MRLIPVTARVPDRTDQAARAREGSLSDAAHAAFGRAAVDVGTPDRGLNDDFTDAIDAIANIAHWIAATGGDPRTALVRAYGHFQAEIGGRR
jgi:hypothetical protein